MKKIIEDVGMSVLYAIAGGGILTVISWAIYEICSI